MSLILLNIVLFVYFGLGLALPLQDDGSNHQCQREDIDSTSGNDTVWTQVIRETGPFYDPATKQYSGYIDIPAAGRAGTPKHMFFW